jgi:hypothetical protein
MGMRQPSTTRSRTLVPESRRRHPGGVDGGDYERGRGAARYLSELSRYCPSNTEPEVNPVAGLVQAGSSPVIAFRSPAARACRSADSVGSGWRGPERLRAPHLLPAWRRLAGYYNRRARLAEAPFGVAGDRRLVPTGANTELRRPIWASSGTRPAAPLEDELVQVLGLDPERVETDSAG